MSNSNRIPDGTQPGDHLAFMQNPSYWPNWPYQTIKKRSATPGQFPDVAVLIDFGSIDKPVSVKNIHFVEACLFLLTKEDTKKAREAGPVDLEKLVSDGWVVD